MIENKGKRGLVAILNLANDTPFKVVPSGRLRKSAYVGIAAKDQG